MLLFALAPSINCNGLNQTEYSKSEMKSAFQYSPRFFLFTEYIFDNVVYDVEVSALLVMKLGQL